MRPLLAFAAGVLTGLALTRIPHLGPLFNDQPETPVDHEPKYAVGGRYVTKDEFNEWTERYAQMGAVPA